MMNRQKRLEERAAKTRAAAHDRVIQDGTIQFRLDAENMDRLLKFADERRTGTGVLARMWVLEKLNKETIDNADVLSAFVTATEQLTELQTQMNSLSKVVQTMLPNQAKAS
jgi:lipoate-protein ligase A